MSKVIEKKVLSEYFEQIISGQKTFELRLADWDCRPDDVLKLVEINPETKLPSGRSVERTVGYVLKTKDLKLFPREDVETYGYQIISLLSENE